MACTKSCLKYFLNIINIYFALNGLLIIGFATHNLSEAPTALLIYMYAIGITLFAASIIGCCGICQENMCLTTTYGFILLGFFVVQVFGLLDKDNIGENIIKSYVLIDVAETWELEQIEPGAMDAIQSKYECCARFGPDDYVIIGRTTLPDSCYPNGNNNISMPYYTRGCSRAANLTLDRYLNYINDGMVVSCVLTALSFCSVFYLVRLFRKDRQRYTYRY